MMTMILRGAATMAALWGGEKVLSSVTRSGAQAAPADPRLPPPPRFTEAQVALLTRDVGGIRVFDDKTARGLREALTLRSACRIRVSEIPQGAWLVCPLSEEAETAADVVDRLAARGYTVLGSLSLCLVRLGSPEAALIVAARGEVTVHELCGAGGHFAVLSAPAPRAPEVAVEQPAEGAPEPPVEVVEQAPARGAGYPVSETRLVEDAPARADAVVVPLASRRQKTLATRANGAASRTKEDEGDAERDPARA